MAASLDCFQQQPEPCIVEIKSWQSPPEELTIEDEAQVIMQLAISVESKLIEWRDCPPKALVVAVVPKSDQFSIYEVKWDRDAKETWFNIILPKGRLFYLHGILPNLA